jgi:DNA-directed RNA polymerase specialized sigma24 family protein
MESTPLTPEAQATELLRIGGEAATRTQLLRYALKLCGDPDTANDYYQQALLDGHDAIQHRGFAGSRDVDYKFYLMGAIKSKHAAEVRRKSRLAPLTQRLMEGPEQVPRHHAHHRQEHLAAQVAREIEEHPDRVLFRLSVDGYSSRQIETLTGRPWRTVARRVAQLKEQLRQTFAPKWRALE